MATSESSSPGQKNSGGPAPHTPGVDVCFICHKEEHVVWGWCQRSATPSCMNGRRGSMTIFHEVSKPIPHQVGIRRGRPTREEADQHPTYQPSVVVVTPQPTFALDTPDHVLYGTRHACCTVSRRSCVRVGFYPDLKAQRRQRGTGWDEAPDETLGVRVVCVRLHIVVRG